MKGPAPAVALVTRRQLLPEGTLPARVEALAATGVSLIQVREKDLDTASLCTLVHELLMAVRRAGSHGRVVVNGRLDVALACGAHGVHLPARGLPAGRVRHLVPPPLLVGVSAHTPEELLRARDAGADYAFFGPVFPTASHPEVPGLGPEAVAAAVQMAAPLPVWAIGGITPGNVASLRGTGIAGVAAIRSLLLAAGDGAPAALGDPLTSPVAPG